MGLPPLCWWFQVSEQRVSAAEMRQILCWQSGIPQLSNALLPRAALKVGDCREDVIQVKGYNVVRERHGCASRTPTSTAGTTPSARASAIVLKPCRRRWGPVLGR